MLSFFISQPSLDMSVDECRADDPQITTQTFLLEPPRPEKQSIYDEKC